jgi:acetolactate synthase-1/2/3 large subunit
MIAKYQGVVLAGLDEPLTYFGRPGFDSRILKEEQKKSLLVAAGQDVVDALEKLADALGAPDRTHLPAGLMVAPDRPALPEGRLTVEKASRTLAAIQPEGAIIVEEGITSCSAYYPVSRGAPPHRVLTVAGGNIGWGMPCAIGAALACPERPVISFEGDGSAMYTIQALWTQAREGLNITTLIFSNRLYNAVRQQFVREGVSPGPAAKTATEFTRPPIGWVDLARGLGVPAESVTTSEGLARALRTALIEPGPHLIELVLGESD